MNKIFIDTREMEYPLPLQIALNYLQNMLDSDYIYMLNIRKPIPLLEIAKERGFNYFTHKDASDIWHIIISRDREIALEELLDV